MRLEVNGSRGDVVEQAVVRHKKRTGTEQGDKNAEIRKDARERGPLELLGGDKRTVPRKETPYAVKTRMGWEQANVYGRPGGGNPRS